MSNKELINNIEAIKQAVTKQENEYKEQILLLNLALVDRPMMMTELSDILGLTTHGIRKWNRELKSGVRFSFVYAFVVKNKPDYSDKLEKYIRSEVRKKINLLEY
mgnify:CR=1 FL=1